jgi:hypothetical protein
MATLSERKTCKRCRQSKPLDTFAYHPGTLDHRQSYCQPCMTQYRRDWLARKTPEARAAWTQEESAKHVERAQRRRREALRHN